MPAGDLDLWLVRTKFQPPRPPPALIRRTRLVAALREALISSRLTLISAPAGYGKTTLLAALAAAPGDFAPGSGSVRAAGAACVPGESMGPARPLAWLTLDVEDNDPTVFLAGLIAALRRLQPACGATAQTLLNGPSDLTGPADPAAHVRRIVGVLINDVFETCPDPFVLARDNLHLIVDSIVHSALDYLLDLPKADAADAPGDRHSSGPAPRPGAAPGEWAARRSSPG